MKQKTYNLINKDVKNRLIGTINSLECNGKIKVVISEVTSVRTAAQNRLYWLWMKKVSEGYHLSGGKLVADHVWHEYFKDLFLPTEVKEVMGSTVTIKKSTTKLKVKEFAKYLQNIDLYVGSEMEIILPHPEDLYSLAIYGQHNKS